MNPTNEKQEVKDIDQLWDEHSEYIDDDSHSFMSVAGSTIMKRRQFVEAVNPILSENARLQAELSEAKVENGMLKEKIKDMTFAFRCIGVMLKSKIGALKVVVETDSEIITVDNK